LQTYIILFLSGVFSAIINVMAGGGSIFTITALVFVGVPSNIANGTFRVAILMQNIVGVKILSQKHKLSFNSKTILPAIVGACFGSFFATTIDSAIFDRFLAFAIVFVVIMIVLDKKKSNYSPRIPAWLEVVIFAMVGFYGGFIQAGVGFILLGAFSLIDNKQIISANAHKLLVVLCYIGFTVVIFGIKGQIIWHYGLVIGCGSIVGAFISAKLALQKGSGYAKVILIIAMIFAVIKLLI